MVLYSTLIPYLFDVQKKGLEVPLYVIWITQLESPQGVISVTMILAISTTFDGHVHLSSVSSTVLAEYYKSC